MANERRNERAKLLGNWCNAGSVAMISLGTLAPVIGGIYEWFRTIDPARPLVSNWQIPALWLMLGIAAHALGHLFLEWIVDHDDQ